jgi:hypothetical protein
MSHANGLAEALPAGPFAQGRHQIRVDIPQSALERLSGLAGIPAHFRPTFANSLRELFGQSHRWHRIATRSVEMDLAAKELGRIAKDARKLKTKLDQLSKQGQVTLGLHALRLDRYGEADSHAAVRDQIEEILCSGELDQAVKKVGYLAWAVGRLGSAAGAETWPRPRNGAPARWKKADYRAAPYLDTFDHFVIELGKAIEACNGAVRFSPHETNTHLIDFLEAAMPYLPDGFVPKEVFESHSNGERAENLRPKMFRFFGLSA